MLEKTIGLLERFTQKSQISTVSHKLRFQDNYLSKLDTDCFGQIRCFLHVRETWKIATPQSAKDEPVLTFTEWIPLWISCPAVLGPCFASAFNASGELLQRNLPSWPSARWMMLFCLSPVVLHIYLVFTFLVIFFCSRKKPRDWLLPSSNEIYDSILPKGYRQTYTAYISSKQGVQFLRYGPARSTFFVLQTGHLYLHRRFWRFKFCIIFGTIPF